MPAGEKMKMDPSIHQIFIKHWTHVFDLGSKMVAHFKKCWQNLWQFSQIRLFDQFGFETTTRDDKALISVQNRVNFLIMICVIKVILLAIM